MGDQRLLREFVEDGSQAAFSELCRRYIRLVYSTCLRELGDAETAQDATQVVFLLLARKARSLRGQTHLPAWLFHASRLTAKNIAKQEQRRARREQRVVEQMAGDDEAREAEWDTIDPLLNGALASLNARDRDAILLRYFEGRTLADIGTHLGVSEDGARKRVNRALERVRVYFTRRDIVVPLSALALLLAAHAAHAVPAACAAEIAALSASAAAGAAASAYANIKIAQLAQGVTKSMTLTTLTRTAIALSIVCAAAGGLRRVVLAEAPSPAPAEAPAPQAEPSQTADPRVVALLNKVQVATDAAKTMTADFSYTTITPRGDTIDTKHDVGVVRLMKPNFADITYDKSSTLGKQIVSDGSNVWTYSPFENTYTKIAADPQGKNISVWRLITIGGFYSVSTWIRRGVYVRDLSELTYEGKETINGEEYEVLEHKMTGSLRGTKCPFDQKVYIASDGFVHRYTLNFTLDGKPGSEVADLTNIKTGQTMDPASFIFTPPAGSHEIATAP